MQIKNQLDKYVYLPEICISVDFLLGQEHSVNQEDHQADHHDDAGTNQNKDKICPGLYQFRCRVAQLAFTEADSAEQLRLWS